MPTSYLWTGTTSGDFSVSTNFSPNGNPVSGDTVIFQNNSVSVTAGLNQAAVTLALLQVDMTYTGAIGSATAYLQISATTLNMGQSSGNGSGRLMINLGSNQSTITIFNSSNNSLDSGFPPIRLLGTHASNKIYALNGIVGVAVNAPGEVSTILTLNIDGNPTVIFGSGVTLTTATQLGGQLTLNAGATTVLQTTGNLFTLGSGAITTLTVGGIGYLNSTGTITTLTVLNGGQANFATFPAARTVTNCNAAFGANINLQNGNKNSITLTNGVILSNCQLQDISLLTWVGNTISIS